jgi:hypothetical protein
MDRGQFLPAARLWLRAQKATAAVEASAGAAAVPGPVGEVSWFIAIDLLLQLLMH